MSITQRLIPTTPKNVFAVLADGWAYASWVVGATHIRNVDSQWPTPGSRIQHSVGLWPLSIKDSTSVEEMELNRYLQLRARAWPLGEARVRIILKPYNSDQTMVTIDEVVIAGIGSSIPEAIISPLFKARNDEALRRLSDIAVHRGTNHPHHEEITNSTDQSPGD
jgi:hypothetical protein